jgi:hypothetical protein
VKQAKGNKLIRQWIANDDLTVHSLLLEKDTAQKRWNLSQAPTTAVCFKDKSNFVHFQTFSYKNDASNNQ